MLARRWGGIFTAVCMVMHGRREPVDVCGLDPSYEYHVPSMTARIRARHPQTKSHGAHYRLFSYGVRFPEYFMH